MVDVSQYKIGLVVSLLGCGNERSKNGKALKACNVNLGDKNNTVTIVTSASNVREGSRIIVALEGATFVDAEGEEVQVKKTSVGGVLSEGIMCDSRMLGWSGGGAGVAAQVSDSFELGSAPPTTKPRPREESPSEEPKVEVKGLFDKKLTKEEKKKLADEKRRARKAAKEARKALETSSEPSENQ